MSKSIFLRRRQRGFTLIELIVVMAIIVVAGAYMISRARSIRQTSLVQGEQSNLQAIVSKVNSSFAGRPNYSGLSTAYLLALGAFPSSMVNGTNVVNSWQGAVTVAPGAGNTTMDITEAGIPSAACIEFVSNVSRSFNEVTVGTTKTKNGADLSDPDTTQTACQASDTVSITFNAN